MPVCDVGTRLRSFHSWHAASHALQPIQVDVSMYFETVGSVRIPVVVPHIDAEECLISSVCEAIAASSYALSRVTRNALYSGVQVFGSPDDDVRKFASGPVCSGAPA